MTLNRIENPSMRIDLYIKFECKTSMRTASVGIKYSMRDQICGVINYCASYFAVEKIKCYGQTVGLIKKTEN